MIYSLHDIVVYFSYKYEGDFDNIYQAIKKREKIDDDLYQRLLDMKIKAITLLDNEYPSAFKNIYRSPFTLFYEGDLSLLNDKTVLAVVGSRYPSKYGEDALRKVMSELLSKKDVTIVSGLAKGIDRIAHEEALKYGKNTIAILGTGMDYFYPDENYSLFEEIKESGLVLSEYPPFVKAKPSNFPERNRIISALAKGVLVADAKLKSGTNTTIRHALEQGKDVYAIPHSILEESLCNNLIVEGATPIISGNDLINALF